MFYSVVNEQLPRNYVTDRESFSDPDRALRNAYDRLTLVAASWEKPSPAIVIYVHRGEDDSTTPVTAFELRRVQV